MLLFYFYERTRGETMAYDIGPKIGIDGEAEFRKKITIINTTLATMGQEMQAVTTSFGKNDKSVESLAAQNGVLNKQIDTQKQKLSELKNGLEQAKEKYGENDTATQKWQATVYKAETDLNKMNTQLSENEKALSSLGNEATESSNDVKKLGDSTVQSGEQAEKSTSKWESFAQGVGGSIAKVSKAIGAMGIAVATGLVGAVEGTKEFREDLGKLNANAQASKVGLETTNKALKDLTTISGEADSSVEAVSNLLAGGFKDNNMQSAIDAISGAVVKFPDTMKVESLADSLQETLASGSATGQYGELLERLGYNLDDFNAKMGQCATDTDKQNLAIQYLNDKGLSELNESYRDTNKSLVSNAEAQFELTKSLSDMAAVAEPAIAGVKSELAGMLSKLTDAFSKDGLAGLSDAIGEVVNDMLNIIVENLPSFVDSAVRIINSILEGIQKSLPQIAQCAVKTVSSLLTGLIQMLPQLLQTGITLIVELAKGIAQELPNLIPLAIDTILTLVDVFVENIDIIVDAGIDLLLGLMDGIMEALPSLIEKVPVIINKLFEAFEQNFPKIIETGIALIGKLITGLIEAIPSLIAAMPDIIKVIVNSLTTIPIIDIGIDLIKGLGKGIGSLVGWIGEKVGEIGSSILKKFGDFSLWDVGVNLIKGLWNGINNVKDWILDKIKGFGKSILKGIKSFFGIKSPSTKMRDQVGKYLAQGIGVGFDQQMNSVSKQMQKAIPSSYDLPDINAIENKINRSPLSAINGFGTGFKEFTEINISIAADVFANAIVPTIDLIQGTNIQLTGRGLASS